MFIFVSAIFRRPKSTFKAAGTFSIGSTIAAIEANNNTHYLQKPMEKFPLSVKNVHFVVLCIGQKVKISL